jgi:putative transposase
VGSLDDLESKGKRFERNHKGMGNVVTSLPLPAPNRGPDEQWVMDFLSGLTWRRWYFRIPRHDRLTGECVALVVDASIGGARWLASSPRLLRVRGLPATLVMDNEPEFTARGSMPGLISVA